ICWPKCLPFMGVSVCEAVVSRCDWFPSQVIVSATPCRLLDTGSECPRPYDNRSRSSLDRSASAHTSPATADAELLPLAHQAHRYRGATARSSVVDVVVSVAQSQEPINDE